MTDKHTPKLEQLTELPFLKGLSAPQLETLASDAMEVSFDAGEMIFREDDPANRFYLILSGSVELESDGKEFEQVPIQIVGAGEVLGWSWLFPPYYWHFSARTLEPTKAVFFYAAHLREQCEADHDLGYEIMRRVAETVIKRLQATRRQLVGAKPTLNPG